MLLRFPTVATLAMLLVAKTYGQAAVPTVPPQAAQPQHQLQNTCTGECVPYNLCSENEIITDGSGIGSGDDEDSTVENECPNIMDTCCKKRAVLEVSPAPMTSISAPIPCGQRNADGIGFMFTENENGESEYGEFPWMVAVLREKKGKDSVLKMFECGGSLIAPNVVLTAAHCIANKQQDTLLVRGGEWDTETSDEMHDHQNRSVREVIVHERFNQDSMFNDVALLILDQPFDLAENIQPVCLPPRNHIFDGSRCFASGWGKNMFGKYQAILRKVEMPVVTHQSCENSLRATRLGLRFILDRSFICAGGETGQDTCHSNDEASSLVCPIPGTPMHYYQAGIVAWGIGCGEQGIPGVYVNVAMFRDWIDQQLSQRQVEAKHYTYA